MAKVYIAAPYPLRGLAREMMYCLEQDGHIVTSRWLRGLDEDQTAINARIDLEDVASANALLALNLQGWEDKGTGGRHVELGYALALNKCIILLGSKSNIFHYLREVISVLDYRGVLACLTAVDNSSTKSS